jgi:hypothetical protein
MNSKALSRSDDKYSQELGIFIKFLRVICLKKLPNQSNNSQTLSLIKVGWAIDKMVFLPH